MKVLSFPKTFDTNRLLEHPKTLVLRLLRSVIQLASSKVSKLKMVSCEGDGKNDNIEYYYVD